MDIIIERDELVTPKAFAALVKADAGAVERLIKARELDCEAITDGRTRRVYVNLDMFLHRAQAQGLSVVAMFKKLCRK